MGNASFLADRRGATAVAFSLSSVALLCLAGLVVDVGDLFSAKRRLQGTTDLAAISGAAFLSSATQAAQASATANGYPANEVTLVEPGIYTPNLATPPAARFQPSGATGANAVRVTMVHQQPVYFGGVFSLAGGATGPAQTNAGITTQAIATNQNVAEFTIGSGVVSVNNGIANAVLGQAVGGSVSLSAADYATLASTQVDLFALARTLSAQVGTVGGTYQQATSGTITMSQLLTALAALAPGAAEPLESLQASASLGSTTVDLANLVEYGPFANLSLLDPEPHVSTGASVLNLLQAAAQAGGTAHLINLSLGATLPGIASAVGMLALGEPPVTSPLIALDRTGSSVHTAQARLYLNITLGGIVQNTAVHFPIYVEIGSATASLAALSCNALDQSTTTATLDVTPGLVNGWIGTVTPAQMTNFSMEPNVAPANVLNVLGLLTVSAQASASVANQTPTPVQFTEADIKAGTVKTTNTTDFTASLLNSLLARSTFSVNGVGVPGVQASVAAALTAAAPAVDMMINSVLETAGVGLGQASTWINGAKCGAGVLTG